ncbi:hypothetical protein SAMN05444858_109167 [Micromonospora avicenniae]|uniref:Uncharacterized protein n=1 Tax=Micromonospora avicenniae TaxID=1198245 RepID=A0A1N7AK63_9ACTN|nr:hypothetical protein SAMN05444858_109167 [Micromonospora avicenniae]
MTPLSQAVTSRYVTAPATIAAASPGAGVASNGCARVVVTATASAEAAASDAAIRTVSSTGRRSPNAESADQASPVPTRVAEGIQPAGTR